MPFRVSLLDNYAVKLHDISMTRNPLAQEVYVVFNEVTRDHYQDAVITEVARIKKLAMVKKQIDMHYVQELGAPLLEDVDQPWEISLSVTGFESVGRIPRMDDMVVVDGVVYSIAEVRPMNRKLEGILILTVYPERSSYVESLEIVDIKNTNGFLDIIYKGKPTKMRAHIISQNQRIATAWAPFKSIIAPPGTIFKATYNRFAQWPVYSSVQVSDGEYDITNTDGAPELEVVDGYVHAVDPKSKVWYTADGYDPGENAFELDLVNGLALNEWYDIEVMDDEGSVFTYFRYNMVC